MFDANLEQKGRIRVETSSGAVLTSEAVLEALKTREMRRARAIELNGQNLFARRAILKRHRGEDEKSLEEARKTRRMKTDESRSSRRAIRRLNAARVHEVHPFTLQMRAPAN